MICGEGIQETLIRECVEEASIPEELARTATSAGCVRYCSPPAYALSLQGHNSSSYAKQVYLGEDSPETECCWW